MAAAAVSATRRVAARAVGAVAHRAGAWAPARWGPASVGSVRHLNLHEYQGKDLMESYGAQVQKGKMAATADEAFEVAKWIKEANPEAELILKAQIHAGGRGKGHFTNGFKGGVKICTTPEEVREYAAQMLGSHLVTKQTGPEGQLCNKVLVNEGISIDRETYFAILLDRAHNGPVVVASTEGGMDIEEVAEKTPEAIVKVPIDIQEGMTEAQGLDIAAKLGFTGAKGALASKQFRSLYDMFVATDATQVEINPMAEGGVPGGASGLIFAVDAKLNFDDNATFRQGAIFDQRDKSMEDPRDVRAEEADLNYIGLDGSIGCLVNGAGLAMATMDIIKLHGGSPANFLDVGGGATETQVQKAFELLNADPKVKAILVNIFGGIMRCDVIAQGIVNAAAEIGLKKPLVVRLQGTNVAQAKELIDASGYRMILVDDLDDAAAKAVKVAEIVTQAEEIDVGVSFELPL